jgi:hypothetical protein
LLSRAAFTRLLLQNVAAAVEKVVEELVRVLVHVGAEELVVLLEASDETLGSNHASALFSVRNLCE